MCAKHVGEWVAANAGKRMAKFLPLIGTALAAGSAAYDMYCFCETIISTYRDGYKQCLLFLAKDFKRLLKDRLNDFWLENQDCKDLATIFDNQLDKVLDRLMSG